MMPPSSFRLVVCSAIVAASAVLPSSAHADAIGFTGPMTFTGTGPGSSVSIRLSPVQSSFISVFAGELNWKWGDQDPATPNVVPGGFASTFYSYCIDITQYLVSTQTATVQTSDGFTNGVAYGGAKAAWLVQRFAHSIHNNLNSLSGSQLNVRAAALQVAIWEAMYDTVGSVTGGNFRLNTTGAIGTQAQTYINALYSAYGTGGVSAWTSSSALVLNVGRGQDQITRNVPEASSLWFTGIGFFLLASLARRGFKIAR
jgi:hypothetical protein